MKEIETKSLDSRDLKVVDKMLARDYSSSFCSPKYLCRLVPVKVLFHFADAMQEFYLSQGTIHISAVQHIYHLLIFGRIFFMKNVENFRCTEHGSHDGRLSAPCSSCSAQHPPPPPLQCAGSVNVKVTEVGHAARIGVIVESRVMK